MRKGGGLTTHLSILWPGSDSLHRSTWPQASTTGYLRLLLIEISRRAARQKRITTERKNTHERPAVPGFYNCFELPVSDKGIYWCKGVSCRWGRQLGVGLCGRQLGVTARCGVYFELSWLRRRSLSRMGGGAQKQRDFERSDTGGPLHQARGPGAIMPCKDSKPLGPLRPHGNTIK